MKTKNQISEKNRKFVEYVLSQKSFFDALGGNVVTTKVCKYFSVVVSSDNLRNTLASSIVSLTELLKAYQISSRAMFDLSAAMSEEEFNYWYNAYEQTKLLLQYFSERSLADAAFEIFVSLQNLIRNNPKVRAAKGNLLTAELAKVANGDEHLEKQLSAAVRNAVFYRDLAEMYCDVHRRNVGPDTSFNSWFRLYNSFSSLLGLPMMGFTRRDIRKMSANSLQYCADLLKHSVEKETDARKKAKMKKALREMEFDIHLRELYSAGKDDNLLKAILYKNFFKAKPFLTAEQCKDKARDEEAQQLKICMTATKNMIENESCPQRADMLEDALDDMFDRFCKLVYSIIKGRKPKAYKLR